MQNVDEILKKMRAAQQAGDPDLIDALRQEYLEIAPSSDLRSDIRYRHGLSKLFRHQDVSGAMALFKEAAANKSAPIAPEARISYALCLRTQQKYTQAIFELKKLLPQSAKPNFHTAQALDFLSLIMRESPTVKDAELDAIDQRRVEHLNALSEESENPHDKAEWLLRLAAAYSDSGTRSDVNKARQTLQRVIKMGKSAGTRVKSAREQMKTLAR